MSSFAECAVHVACVFSWKYLAMNSACIVFTDVYIRYFVKTRRQTKKKRYSLKPVTSYMLC